MVLWLNRGYYLLPRNATNTHTLTPSSSTGLVAGAAFTPTAGRRLVAVIEGSVTSTGTSGGTGATAPSGWSGGAATTGYNAVNNTGLYLVHKVAAGADTLVLNHNGANYPIGVMLYEFPAGTTLVAAVAATGVALGGANPNLTGLTGTNLVMAAVAGGHNEITTTPPGTVWTGVGTPVEDLDTFTPKVGTDGFVLSIAYVEGHTATSWQPTGTVSAGSGGMANKEAITWAINVPGGGTDATVTAVPATIGVTAPVPTLPSLGAGTVNGIRATVTSAAPVPVVSGSAVVTAVRAVIGVTVPISAGSVTASVGGAVAAVTVSAKIPTVSVGTNAAVNAVTAAVSAAARVPGVSVGGSVSGVTAAVTASAPAPSVNGSSGASVAAVPATITVTVVAPFASAGGSVNISAPAVALTATAQIPGLSVSATITATLATVRFTLQPPTVSGTSGVTGATVNGVSAAITVNVRAATVTGLTGGFVPAPTVTERTLTLSTPTRTLELE